MTDLGRFDPTWPNVLSHAKDIPWLSEGVYYLPIVGPHRHQLGPLRQEQASFAWTRSCIVCDKVIMLFPIEKLEQLHPRHPWRVAHEKLEARRRFLTTAQIRSDWMIGTVRKPRSLLAISTA